MDTKNEAMVAGSSLQLLRHTVATLAYRGGKAVRGAPEKSADFRAGNATRTPGQILAQHRRSAGLGLVPGQWCARIAQLRSSGVGSRHGAFLHRASGI